MNNERLWEQLINSLDEWSSASAVDSGRIEVAVPDDDSGRRVKIMMTPGEWEDMVDVMWGDFEDAVQEVKRTLLRLQPHERFAVYAQYQLEPSTGPSLPEDHATPEPGGEWVAHDRDGRVISRFAEWSDPTSAE